MEQDIKNILKGKIVIIGIGNVLRGDDAFGPMLIERLTRSLRTEGGLNDNVKIVCIDAGSAPENYTGKIVKENPDTVLIVDVVHLDLSPGEWRILMKDDILKSGFTTHDISPNMFIEYLENQTNASIYMLGVQPQNISIGSQMSDALKITLDKIQKLIKDAIHA